MAGDGWLECRVGDIAAPTKNALVGGPFESDLVSRDYVAFGVPVIRGQNMGLCRWISGDFVFVTAEKAESLRGNLASPCDIVFTQRGTLGQVAIVPPGHYDRYLVSQSQMKLTVDVAKADPLFVYYVFRGQEQKDYIRRNAIQTGVPHTNLGILRDTPLLLPPLKNQRAIAHILGTLDDKIELNRRMNETLEAMARALFKSWFVDFDPVRAKRERRQPPGMDAATAALFPDSFQESPLGEIPKGWKTGSFAGHVEILSGGTPKTSVAEYWDGDIRWYTVKDAPADSDVWVLDTERNVTQAGIENSAAEVFAEKTGIISARGTVGKLALTGVPMAMNQSCYGIKGRNGYSPLFTYYNLRAAVGALQQRTHGTVFDTITRETFATLDCCYPPPELAQQFDVRSTPVLERMRANLRESRSLGALRDALLPKLLSGGIRVWEAERSVEEVT